MSLSITVFQGSIYWTSIKSETLGTPAIHQKQVLSSRQDWAFPQGRECPPTLVAVKHHCSSGTPLLLAPKKQTWSEEQFLSIQAITTKLKIAENTISQDSTISSTTPINCQCSFKAVGDNMLQSKHATSAWNFPKTEARKDTWMFKSIWQSSGESCPRQDTRIFPWDYGKQFSLQQNFFFFFTIQKHLKFWTYLLYLPSFCFALGFSRLGKRGFHASFCRNSVLRTSLSVGKHSHTTS